MIWEGKTIAFDVQSKTGPRSKFQPTEGDLPKCNVVLEETVTIPEGGQMMVPAVLKQVEAGENQVYDGHLTTNQKFEEKYGVLVAETVINTGHEKVPLRVLNITTKPVKVYKGSVAATCEPVTEIHVVGTKTVEQDGLRVMRVNRESTDQVPEYLLDLFERSVVNLDAVQRRGLVNLLLEYADVFAKSADDMGRTGLVKHRINTGDAQPIRQRARRLPIQQRKEEQALIKEMLDRQVITPSSSPWASGIVLVKKKDGSWRFCVDYRRLNEVTVKDSFGLPRIDDSLDTLGGAKWFSTLDLQSGYWQVEMEEGSKEKTAFICSSGLYQFERMPFGLCNSPATFERLMERVLAGLQWQVCLIFLDDVIVYGTSFGNQLERLQLVFERLRSANLKTKSQEMRIVSTRSGVSGAYCFPGWYCTRS